MNDIKVVELTEFPNKICDLTEKEMADYKAKKREIAKRFHELCEDVSTIRGYEDKHNIRWTENKQMIVDAYCLMLQMTSNAGSENHVAKMVYERSVNGDEIVYPILANGNANWYTAHVTGDSGTAMISDITNQFVRKAW